RSALLLLLPLRFDSPDDALLSCTRRWRVWGKGKAAGSAWLAALLFVAAPGVHPASYDLVLRSSLADALAKIWSIAQDVTTMFFPHFVGDACSRKAAQRGNEAVTAAVVLVAVTTRAAAPGRACARRLRGAAAEAPGPSQGSLSGLSASGRWADKAPV